MLARPRPQVPQGLSSMANRDSPMRIAMEAALGPRSFRAFYRMAWRDIDPAHLLWSWHMDTLCDLLQAAARREERNIAICIPPRLGKSNLVSVAFPAWVWTWFPAAKFITASYEMTLATRDAVKTRRLVQSEWYQQRWGPLSRHLPKGHPGVELQGDQNNKTFYETTAGGHRFCATPGRMVTGHGGDFIIGDDLNHILKAESPISRQEVLDWWFEVIPSRLNEQDRGVKIIVQQRVHTHDLAGECIRRGYHKVVLPMEFEADHPDRSPLDMRTVEGELLHPARMSMVGLTNLKTALGTYGTAGQLQQRPAPRGGGLFKREWFLIVDEVPVEAMASTVRKWDLAATRATGQNDPDYTASVKLGRDEVGHVYILDVTWMRDTPSSVDNAIKVLATHDGTRNRTILPQDPGAAGVGRMEAQARFFAPLAVEFVAETKETGGKVERARGLIAFAEAGNLRMKRAPWNEHFLTEISEFPNAAHDDIVDAASGAFTALYGDGTGLLDYYRELHAAASSGQDGGSFRTTLVHTGTPS